MPTSPSSKKRPWQPERKAQSGRLFTTDFYHSTAWRRLRKSFLAAHPLCVACKQKGMITRATQVDHIKQINRLNPWDMQGDKYPHPLDADNLQGLCAACHAAKSGRERHAVKNT